MGKSIDKRFAELGGDRFLPLYCADEATNMEEVVEAFKAAVLDALDKITHETNEVDLSALSISPEGAVVMATNGQDNGGVVSCFPAGLLKAQKILELTGHGSVLSSRPDAALLPRSMGSEITIEFQEQLQDVQPPLPPEEWTVERPYTAKIKRATWLTSNQPEEVPSGSIVGQLPAGKVAWGESKRVVHMEVSLGAFPSFAASPTAHI